MNNTNSYNGFADLFRNAFIGNKPHELIVCITTGNFGNIRRFAVSSVKEAEQKCKDMNVVLTKIYC